MDGWTVRLIAAAVLTLSGAAGGRSLAASRRLRVKQLDELASALSRLKIQMLEKMLALREALNACGNPAFAAIALKMKGTQSAGAAWRMAREELRARGGALSCLDAEDAEALNHLFENLGTTGASEQRLLLASAQEALARLAESARKKADEQAKLYTSLGLIAGLALSVCLL